MLRDPKTNQVPRAAAKVAFQIAQREDKIRLKQGARFNATLPTFSIQSRGPSNYGGRVRCLSFDSRNKMIGLTGGVSGGIFRTTDGGGTWTDVTPPGQIHNITTLTQDRSSGNENYWYAAGGEQKGNSADGSGAFYYGNGVWRSSDNGLTWSLLSNTTNVLEKFDTQWDFVHRIIVNPANGDVYAGNSGGVYKSTNRGDSWTNVLSVTGQANSGIITEIIRTPSGVFYAAISGQGIYKSTTGDNNSWTQIADVNQLEANFDRIILAFAPSNDNIIYAFYNLSVNNTFPCNNTTSQVRLRRWDNASNDGNGSWTGNYDDDISNCANTMLTLDPQGGYNLALAVRPNNENEVFIGGERLYRFTVTSANEGTYAFAGGDQSSPTATNLHVDQHWLTFIGNDTLWVTNDGGIRYSNVSTAPDSTNGFNWTNKNNGLITYQFYRGDITPNQGSDLVGGGAQDNANTIMPHGTTVGTELGGGDGFQFAIISGTNTSDYKTLTSIQKGHLFRYIANMEEVYITPKEGGEEDPEIEWQGFATLFALDADNTNFCYYPIKSELDTLNFKAQLFRTRAATTVERQVGSDPTSQWQKMTLNGIGEDQDISAFEMSRNTAFNNNAYTASDTMRKLYIGTDVGGVYLVKDPAFASSLSVVNITPSDIEDQRYVSDISVNPYNDKEVMITFSNYGVSSIYHTTDATANPVTWTQIEGSSTGAVAKSSVRSAMILKKDNTLIYIIGTSTGLYGTTMLNGTSTTWERIGSSEIAYALCVDMRLRTSDNHFSLATHGNGLFLLSIPDCIATLALNDNPITANTYIVSDSITSTGRVANGDTVVMDAKNSVTLRPSFTAEKGSSFTAKIGGCAASLISNADEETFASIDQFIETELVSPKKEDLEFAIYPSPTTGEVTIDFYLAQATEAVITLHSTSGNLMKVIQNNTTLDKGNQQLRFNAADFESGLYYVVISTPKVRKTQKLLVQRN
jgi:hypothetical protein